ncbi:MAG: haloacid dehalogenase-like hydrolase [Ahniella sp.]|nr:haloacid dehalogenase-like hydrolase [Ahniella sp.]
MPEMRPQVIVYDLDGTLVAGDVGKAFLHHLLRSAWWRTLLAALVAPVLMPMLHVQGLRRPAISVFLWLGSVGRAGRIGALARAFAAGYPLEILPTATTSLRADLMGPHTVVVATGAWEELSAVLLDRMALPSKPVLVASGLRALPVGWWSVGSVMVTRKSPCFAKRGLHHPMIVRSPTRGWIGRCWPEARAPILVTESPNWPSGCASIWARPSRFWAP